MTINNTSTCPDCEGLMKHYDKVRRIVRAKGGVEHWVNVPRFRCMDCGRVRRALPDNILPYKQYEAEIINNVMNGTITSDTLGYEDYPCEETMKRWTRE